jgi:YVTN family beta-propeller protein
MVYPANGPWNDVSILDLATCTVADRAKIGDSPVGVGAPGRWAANDPGEPTSLPAQVLRL